MIFWILIASIAAFATLLGLASIIDDNSKSRDIYSRPPGDHPDTWRRRIADFLGDVAIIPFAIGVLSLLVFAVGCLVALSSPENTSDPSCKKELSALSAGRANEFSGSFFLGIGSISGGDYRVITYVEKASDGSMQLLEKRASKSRIFEDAPDGTGWVDCSYRLQTFEGGIVAPWWGTVTTGHYVTGYEFHVPEGSVSTQFEVTP